MPISFFPAPLSKSWHTPWFAWRFRSLNLFSQQANWVICVFFLFNLINFTPEAHRSTFAYEKLWKWCSINVKFVSSSGVKKCFAWRKNPHQFAQNEFYRCWKQTSTTQKKLMKMKAKKKLQWHVHYQCETDRRDSYIERHVHRAHTGNIRACEHALFIPAQSARCAQITFHQTSRCNEVKLIEA